MDEQFSFPWISKLQIEFDEFHGNNPEVYSELLKLSFDLKAKGRGKYGVKSLFEIIRWHRAMSTEGDEFKLNNNHAPFYARLIMAQEPELEGFFETRRQRHE
tara:strand:+ start:719 stop:1024 length:306 start_codon:yes stop_codon:yes gene_type:complete